MGQGGAGPRVKARGREGQEWSRGLVEGVWKGKLRPWSGWVRPDGKLYLYERPSVHFVFITYRYTCNGSLCFCYLDPP